ncbi:MAG TPA: RDD family protein [Burkholderiaceae bacterium]|nr:RDD family protein [Burkholderiaceae bacterium]
MAAREMEYVGFWARVLAALIDSVLVLLVIGPVLYWIYGPSYLATAGLGGAAGTVDVLLNWVFPAVAVVVFWIYRQATPGKMVIGAKIVDATTGMPPTTGQLIGRYLGYYVSMIPCFLGMLWIAFDARKQGWHDKLAGTVVIKDRR